MRVATGIDDWLVDTLSNKVSACRVPYIDAQNYTIAVQGAELGSGAAEVLQVLTNSFRVVGAATAGVANASITS